MLVWFLSRLFRPSRPDFIETSRSWMNDTDTPSLFRPSRPDFIETGGGEGSPGRTLHCSGLLGRTSLRLFPPAEDLVCDDLLFRPSRPDFIETVRPAIPLVAVRELFRPSRPDFIETSRRPRCPCKARALFRPSRPDFIETRRRGCWRRPGR